MVYQFYLIPCRHNQIYRPTDMTNVFKTQRKKKRKKEVFRVFLSNYVLKCHIISCWSYCNNIDITCYYPAYFQTLYILLFIFHYIDFIFYHSIRICFINPCKIYILIAPTRSNITAYYITCLISRQCGSIVRAPTRYASDVLSNISYQVFSLSLSFSLFFASHVPTFSIIFPSSRTMSLFLFSHHPTPLFFSYVHSYFLRITFFKFYAQRVTSNFSPVPKRQFIILALLDLFSQQVGLLPI